MTLGIILGSSLLNSDAFSSFRTAVCETPFGNVTYSEGTILSRKVVFIRRHLFDPARPYTIPSEVNYKAMFQAFVQLECKKVIGLFRLLLFFYCLATRWDR
jgi:singapore isolate B (sub-type 7) whole genome shotgun sequence assembly, scaffold_15